MKMRFSNAFCAMALVVGASGGPACLNEKAASQGGAGGSGPAVDPGKPPAGKPPEGTTPPVGSSGGLSDTAIVFGKDVTIAGKVIKHLYSYDLATQAERLISKLDDGDFSSCAVSPDRRSIAVELRNFRRAPEEANTDVFTIWKIGVDGEEPQRLLPPGYLDKLRCDAGAHNYKNERRLSDVVWAGDGRSVAFSMLWAFDDSHIDAGGRLVVDAGNFTVMGGSANIDECEAQDCNSYVPVAPHPSNGRLLVFGKGCRRSASGFAEYTLNPIGRRRELHVPPIAPDQPGEKWKVEAYGSPTHAWLRDGSGLLITVTPEAGVKSRLVRWTESTGEVKTVFTPEKPTQSINKVSVGPTGDALILVTDKVGDKYSWSLKLLNPQSGEVKDVVLPGGSTSVCH
jgi:hypothetical protein